MFVPMAAKEVVNDPIDLQRKIGDKIRELREAKGIKNYEKFAIQNNFSRSHYWNIEHGSVNLTMKTLIRILNSLEVKIDDFFNQLK